jgi:hypothetical protein
MDTVHVFNSLVQWSEKGIEQTSMSSTVTVV